MDKKYFSDMKIILALFVVMWNEEDALGTQGNLKG